MVLQSTVAGPRPWTNVRCYGPPSGRHAGQRPHRVSMTNHPGYRRKLGLRCRHPPLITTTISLSSSRYRRYQNHISAAVGGSDDASSSRSRRGGSDGDEAAAGSWGGGDDLYGYAFDPDESLSAGAGGRGASLAAVAANLEALVDTNSLQTALAAAIQSQDFELAAAVRDRLRQLSGGALAAGRIDWASTGMPDWLADRAQRLGFRFPAEVQRRSSPVLLAGSDAVIASETGSGKTLSFLMPLLARMSYPPDIFLDEMKGPQGLVVVPTLELGVQVALTAFQLLGGNVSSRGPGDAANMFTYFGPKGIKVRGILNKEEVVMAKSSLTYMAQVHLLVATPGGLMEAVREPQAAEQLIKHLKVVAVDEVDECFSVFPRDMDELLSKAMEGTNRADVDARGGGGSSMGNKPQVIFAGATQRPDVLQTAVERGWLRSPVSIQVGREGTIPPALSHRYIVVSPARRLAALARSLRADLAAADQDTGPARVMLFVNSPEEAAAVAEPLRNSLWSDHRMAVLVPPGTLLGVNADEDNEDDEDDDPRGLASPPSSATSPSLSTSTLNRRRRRSSSSSSSSNRTSSSARAGGARGGEEAAPSPSPSESGFGFRSSGSRSGSADRGAWAADDLFAYNPIRVLHSFRDNKSTLLLATAAAARGLDLPGVTHVYSLGLPKDATHYLHRAGRAGRIGSTAGGTVTTLVSPEELPALLEMGRLLGIRLVQEEEATGELVGVLPRLQPPLDADDDGDEEEAAEGAEGGAGHGGPDAETRGGPVEEGATGGGSARRKTVEDDDGGRGQRRQRGSGGDVASQGALDELGDVEKLRKGLEDLFNLM